METATLTPFIHETSRVVERSSESPFVREFEKISAEVRPGFLMPEIVRPIQVYDVESTPVADSLLEKKQDGTPELKVLFVGVDSTATHAAAMRGEKPNSEYSATLTDGRVVRIDFGGSTVNVPGLEVTMDSNGRPLVAKDETMGVPIEGIAIKGGGRSFNFGGQIDRGSIDTHDQYGQRVHEVDLVGGANYRHQVAERDALIQYLGAGARVDVPIADAKIKEKSDFKLGILAIGYRTPFNFRHILNVPSNEIGKTKFLMMHGINVWRREGLIDRRELDAIFVNEPVGYNQQLEQSRNILRFYAINGVRIAGGDLAIIHKFRALGNRNPQNMGDDFSHRDVADYETSRVNEILSGNITTEKFRDVKDDLRNVRDIITRQTREFGETYYFPEATYQYLKAYFEKSTGMSKREFGVNLLCDVITNAIFGDHITSELAKAFRRICLEDARAAKSRG